jgi:hypothetical protein
MMTQPKPISSSPPADPDESTPLVAPAHEGQRGPVVETSSSFWSRHKTVINFWLDAALLVLFLVLAWELAILRLAFPKAAGDRWRLLGHTAADWQDLSFNTFCVFALGIVVHVMLHWSWVVCTIQTRLLKRKATRDDGSHTMMGVGLLFVLIHLLAGGILWARWAIVEVR